jgi:tetratricopeptide (TPR) repeat protein
METSSSIERTFKLPSEHDTAGLDLCPMVRQARTGWPLDRRGVRHQGHQLAAVDDPNEPGAINAGKRPLAITAENVERAPAERRCSLSPSAIQEPASIVEELNPAPRRHVIWRARWIEAGEAFGPVPRRLAVVLDNGREFLMGIEPSLNGALVLTGEASNAVQLMTAGITAYRSTGATLHMPAVLSSLARAYARLDQFDDAWRCIREAIATVEATKERWWEAEIHRIAGETALASPKRGAAKAEAFFEHALTVARDQQAKSFELRAAMSMARLWRDQGKRDEARDLLAPVYGWFTEGFDALDLKQAKALNWDHDEARRERTPGCGTTQTDLDVYLPIATGWQADLLRMGFK